jgi:hypothetical protein
MPFIPCVPSSSRSLTFARHLVLTVFAVVGGATLALAQTPPAPGGPVEGIKVHGHWTIDIRNADGTIASHHEFENALTGQGKRVISGLLTGTEAIAAWAVTLYGNDATDNPCAGPTSARVECVIREQGFAAQFDSDGVNLQVTAPLVHEPPPNSLTAIRFVHLSGSTSSTTASPSSVIARVRTDVAVCVGGLTRVECVAQAVNREPMTTRLLPTPIVVAPGQIIQVTVDITFS